MPDDHDVVDPDRLDEEVARGAAVLDGLHQHAPQSSYFSATRTSHSCASPWRRSCEGVSPVVEDGVGLVERRQLAVVEWDGRLGGGEVGAGVAARPAPRG